MAIAAAVLAAGCLGDAGPRPATTPGTAVGLALEPFLTDLDDPVLLTHAGDGSGRLFVVEQGGRVRVWDDRLLDAAFLDLSGTGANRVQAGGERGLLGLAFHPDYANNGRLFVYYTAFGGDLVLAEYDNLQPADNQADANTERVLLRIEHSQYPNHNGGMLGFGPDGFLYAGTGDGGSGGDPGNNAQDPHSLLGKILRLDVDGGPGPVPYLVPADNPFSDGSGRAEVWALGLRNPWRFSFDRATGDLWIGDVGQNAWEEINREPAGSPGGRNYGWSRFEGTHLYNADRNAPAAVDPVAQYDHAWGGDRHQAVTGGYVYRGVQHPALEGAYLFADFASGFLWSLRADGEGWVMAMELDSDLFVSSFGEDEAGELYVVDLGGGVYRLTAR